MINRMATFEQPPPMYVAPLTERKMRRSEPSEGWGKRVGQMVGDYPILALAAGALAGIVIGCLIKRR